MYGNTFEMANHILEGAQTVEGADVFLKQVADLLPEEVIEKSPEIKDAKEKQKHIPIANPLEIADYDAVIWGTPTRYGNVCAHLRNFMDQTAPLWMEGKLENKVSGVFVSTASLHGGTGNYAYVGYVTTFPYGDDSCWGSIFNSRTFNNQHPAGRHTGLAM